MERDLKTNNDLLLYYVYLSKINKWNILEIVNHWLQSITGLLQRFPLAIQLGTHSFAQLRAPWEGEVLLHIL